jgi:hypothetical protein
VLGASLKLGNLLVAKGLATAADINRAVEHQNSNGGRLGDSIVALGLLTHAQIEAVLADAPQAPISIADTGIDPFCLSLPSRACIPKISKPRRKLPKR